MIAEPPASPAMTYEPRGGALELFRCREREVVYVGPAGTGKTRAVLEKLFLACMKHAGMRALVVRKTRASLTESAMVTFETKVVDKRQLIAQDVQRKFRHSYEFKNGSSIVLGGMDNADRIMSTEFDVVLMVEATEFTEGDLETLHTRLRNAVMPYQQLIAECNPSGPAHWLKRRIDTGKAKEILSRHADNPSVSPEYLEALSKLSGHRRARLYLGQWAAAEGLVYEGFDRNIHIIDAMPDGWESWKKVRAIDFGYTNPFVCGWGAVDNDGRLYIYREMVKAGVTVKNHAERIGHHSRDERYDFTVSDHDAEDRATLAECGIETKAADKDVSSGIQAVADRLRVAGDGRPRLFFLRSALVEPAPEGKAYGCIAEIEGYMWHTAKDGKSAKEEPIKENDHSMDMLRYMIKAIDRPQVPYLVVLDEPYSDREDGW